MAFNFLPNLNPEGLGGPGGPGAGGDDDGGAVGGGGTVREGGDSLVESRDAGLSP
jgi:hypothetical protein